MIKTVFTILLCVHLLGDFYFQTQKMADRKRERFSWTIGHSLIYALGSWLLFFLFLPGMKIRSGQSRFAVTEGMAEWMPNLRAS